MTYSSELIKQHVFNAIGDFKAEVLAPPCGSKDNCSKEVNTEDDADAG